MRDAIKGSGKDAVVGNKDDMPILMVERDADYDGELEGIFDDFLMSTPSLS